MRARLVVLLSIAAVLKLAFLAAPREDLFSTQSRLPETAAMQRFHGEEFSRAGAAISIREGPLVPIGDYQWNSFFGGSLVVSLTAIPFLEVFGRNLFALKLAPLMFELVTVAFGYLLFLRLFGRRAAWIGGLLLAVSVPAQAVLATIVWGTHSSLNAFVVCGLYLYVLTLPAEGREQGDPRQRWLRACFGLVSGFAVYFGYGYLVVLAAVVCFEWISTLRVSLAERYGPMVLGFVIGLSPWLRYNLLYDFQGATIYETPLTEHFAPMELLSSLGHRSASLALEWLPLSLGQRDLFGVPGSWIALAWCLALLGLAGVGVLRLRASLRLALRGLVGRNNGAVEPAFVLVLHATIYTLALCLGDFFPTVNDGDVVTVRYLSPLFPALFGFAGYGAAWAVAHADGPARRVVRAVVAACVVLGVAGSLRLVEVSEWGAFWEHSVDHPIGHGRWHGGRWADDHERFRAVVDRVIETREPEVRDAFLAGMGDGLRAVLQGQLVRGGPVRLERMFECERRLCADLPEEFAVHFRPTPRVRGVRSTILEGRHLAERDMLGGQFVSRADTAGGN